jgi:hypothetical protein
MGISIKIDSALNIDYGSTSSATNLSAISYTIILISRPVAEYCSACPASSVPHGLSCINCQNFSSWQTNGCVCNSGYVNVSGVCQQCPPGTIYNQTTSQCANICQGNSFWQSGQCLCNSGFFNISGTCQQCPAGTAFNNTTITCASICQGNSSWQNN